MEYGVSHYYSNRAKYGNVEVSEESEGAIEMTDKPILSNEDRSEMLRFYQTIKVDGNGKSVKMKYDEHIVRHDTLRLLEDIEHFITVIDSQNRTIKTYEEVQQGWLDSHARNFKQIESQKEEIEKKDRIHNDYRKTALERIAYQEYQIESLKSITELAVDVLERYAAPVNWVHEDVWDGGGNPCTLAKDTLSEIERLTHEAP